jgi:glycosyltransferase involved in cell wall biosynthesis/GT2 family glycosyltransferase
MTARPLDVCIVTCDIVGPIRNGGIGTAYYNLALALARAGHHVTVLYALGRFCEVGTIDEWTTHYARHGVTFVPLEPQPIEGHPAIKMSYATYRWLKGRQFDIVHCHEWRGLGFYTALGKRQGLCLDEAVLCIGAHSPVLWHLEGMNELADDDALDVDFMERESVARADVLWSPSDHMVEWMRREGWRLPGDVMVRPYIVLDAKPAAGAAAPPDSELVFFGRLESRKGLDLFCDALDRLVARGRAPSRVTFLGKPSSVAGVPSGAYLERRARRWPFAWQMLGTLDRDAAQAYLREPNRIAVLPSRLDNLPYTVLECLHTRVPFIAAATGGIPESIAPCDRERTLFPLTADGFADRLEAVLRDGLAPAMPQHDAEETLQGWLAWHGTPYVGRTFRSGDLPAPLVSICVTHRNRPAYLANALESIRQQDYPRIEVVLVDDGSDQAEAIAYLDGLTPEFAERGWQLIRQANRYLGAARNAAIAASRGDYVLFMDDDNVAVPHEVSTFVRAATRTGADVLTCMLDIFQGPAPAPDSPPQRIWPFLGAATAPGLRRNVFGDANAFFARRVFDRIGGFTEDVGVGCEDWELFARAVLSGLHLEVVPEPLVHYRQSPQGMLQSTSRRANEMRALRPYLGLLPAHVRPMVHLASRGRPDTATSDVPRLDHIERAVVFGTGEAGRRAIDLALRCGWTVPWLVDNNPAMWNATVHDRVVREPDALTREPVDLVIVASLAGKPAISAQLERMGLSAGTNYIHFLDPVRVGGLTLQVQL